MTRTIVFAAHPDDETLGCGGALAYLPNVTVVFLTDGAPKDRRFFPESVALERREVYAEIRRCEAKRALREAGISAERVLCLGAIDQESCRQLPRWTRAFASIVAMLQPALIVAPAYEGGHPDHDAAAFVAYHALSVLRPSGVPLPVLIEMTGYHGQGGHLHSGQFLQAPGPPGGARAVIAAEGQRAALLPVAIGLAPIVVRAGAELVPVLLGPGARPVGRQVHFTLTLVDAQRKRRMLACYRSQKSTLASFGLAPHESFRVASPSQCFSCAPHDGPLYYEQLGWATSGAEWRTLATSAAETLGLEPSPPLDAGTQAPP